mgnify:CR=1 FL=1
MNDRQIECFLEAARYLNFTRAAENLTLPQPAVSRYIASLESELGVRLFVRESNRKIVLTPAGRAYFNLFQRTATELAHTRDALSVVPEMIHLGINIGWTTSEYLPKVVEFCRQRNPKFYVAHECLPFHELTAGLREKRLDAVISLEDYLMHSLEFETERFTSLQRSILYSKNLPNYEQIKNPADFYLYDFLIADDPLIRHLVQESENMFRSFRFMPRYRALPNQETVNSYVENGLGVALRDEWCHILHHPHMLHMNIEETIPVALAWRRDAPAAVELLREALLFAFQNQEV